MEVVSCEIVDGKNDDDNDVCNDDENVGIIRSVTFSSIFLYSFYVYSLKVQNVRHFQAVLYNNRRDEESFK